ncbi:hypothetical protein CR513_37931, partial [Mucuna pruriens]
MVVVVDDLEQQHEELRGDTLFRPYGMPSRTIEDHQYDYAMNQQEEGIIPPRPTLGKPQGPKITIENMQACNITFMDRLEDPRSQERWRYLEERLKAIKRVERYRFEAADLCLVPDVIIPHKIKIPDFDKYRGKWTPNYKGPYVVKRAFSRGAMILTNMDGKDLPHHMNLDTVKKFYP